MRIRKKRYQKADAILCGDVHLRETAPRCRTDDFEQAQWEKLKFISNLQKKHNCPVLCSGDLFDVWKPSLSLLAKTAEFLPKQFYTVYGNHDLPQHNLNLMYKSGVHVLDKANVLTVLPGCHWGMKPQDIKETTGFGDHSKQIMVWHIHTYKQKEPWPGCTSPKAKGILKRYPQYDLILTGDNHIPFVEKHEGRILVNPGSMTRQTADQLNFKPRVYLWYADTNEVEAVYLPIKENVISRAHLEETKERVNRVHAFISSLDTSMDYINFEDDLKTFLKLNKVHPKVQQIILKAIEEYDD